MEKLDKYQSYIVEGELYRCLYATGPMFSPNIHRKTLVNVQGALVHFACHFNSAINKKANYAFCILNQNEHRALSNDIAMSFLNKLHKETGITIKPCVVGGPGSGNISRIWCPSILIEPGFISNREWYSFLRANDNSGLKLIGRLLAYTVEEFFPNGGLISFSNDHKNRPKYDPGSITPKDYDPDPEYDEEIELVEVYIQEAIKVLTDGRSI